MRHGLVCVVVCRSISSCCCHFIRADLILLLVIEYSVCTIAIHGFLIAHRVECTPYSSLCCLVKSAMCPVQSIRHSFRPVSLFPTPIAATLVSHPRSSVRPAGGQLHMHSFALKLSSRPRWPPLHLLPTPCIQRHNLVQCHIR